MSALLLSCALWLGAAPAPKSADAGSPPACLDPTSVEGRPIGWSPLPPAISTPPTKLKIPPLDFKVVKPEKVELSNGLRVLLMPDRAIPLVNLAAVMVVGTMDEVPAKLGVAEAMMDLLVSGGAGNRDADALDELLEFLAAQAGGGAGEELSNLGMNIRSEDLNKLLPVFGDILIRPHFQKDRFALHISRSIEGVKRRADSAEGLASRAVRKAVFGPESIFAREKTEKTLRAITVQDVEDFYRRYVTPKSTILLVTGDFDRASMLASLEQVFGKWAGKDRPARSYPPKTELSRRVILVPKQTPQAKIRFGGYGYQRLSPQEYADRVMTTALGGGIGVGRLYRVIRDQLGLAYSAWASVQSGPTTGYFVAGADTRVEQTSAALDGMLRVFTEVAGKQPLDKPEIALATDTFLNSFAFRFDSPEKITQEKAVFTLYGYPEDYLDRFRDHIAEVNVAAVQSAAQRLLPLDQLQIVVVGPPEKVGDLSRFGPVTVVRDVETFR